MARKKKVEEEQPVTAEVVETKKVFTTNYSSIFYKQ